MTQFNCSSGFSIVEVLIAVVILSAALVPAMEALQTGMQGAEMHQESIQQHYKLFGKMETVLAENFSDLDAAATVAGSHINPTSYSVPSDHIKVFIWRYDIDDADADGDVFTGVDEVLWVKTEITNTNFSVESLMLP